MQINKKLIFIILIGLIMIIGAWLLINANVLKKDTSDRPATIVTNFYQSWFNYPTDPLSNQFYLDSPHLSVKMKSQLNDIRNNLIDSSFYDPVICASSFPQSFTVENLELNKQMARVKVVQNFGEQTKEVIISLIKMNDFWLIDDINCLDDQQIITDNLANQDLVANYLRNNISNLSPEPEVLGGTFYVTDIDFLSPGKLLVDYEDGHIALSAIVNYSLNNNQDVLINDFTVLPPDPAPKQIFEDDIMIEEENYIDIEI